MRLLVLVGDGSSEPPEFPGLLVLGGAAVSVLRKQRGALLVDAGGPTGSGGSQFDFGEDVVSPYLCTRGISRLYAVAITQGHSDAIPRFSPRST